jgi:hypothetical protein
MKLICVKQSLEFSLFCDCSKSFYFIEFCLIFNSTKIKELWIGFTAGLVQKLDLCGKNMSENTRWIFHYNIQAINSMSLSLKKMGMSKSKVKTLLSAFWTWRELGSLVKNLSVKQRDKQSAFTFRHVYDIAFVGKATQVDYASRYKPSITGFTKGKIIFDQKQILVIGLLLSCLFLRRVTFYVPEIRNAHESTLYLLDYTQEHCKDGTELTWLPEMFPGLQETLESDQTYWGEWQTHTHTHAQAHAHTHRQNDLIFKLYNNYTDNPPDLSNSKLRNFRLKQFLKSFKKLKWKYL